MATEKISDETLVKIQGIGGHWAAYRNEALDSANVGHIQLLKYGEGCTFVVPPAQYPADTAAGLGWRYRFLGFVDTKTGEVRE